MKCRLTTLALLACGWAAALPAWSLDMKPGLWEMQNSVSSADPQVRGAMEMLQRHMANMAPEQRRQMEQMMQQNGVQLDVGPGGALRTRICMTRGMIARNEFPVQQGECKQDFTRQSASKGRIVFACTRPRVNGEGEITMLGDTSYRAHMKVDSQEGGAARTMDVNVDGRWLGADCGNIRPATIPEAR